MKELIAAFFGAFTGSVLSFILAVRLRNNDRWCLFCEEVGVIKDKFLVIDPAAHVENLMTAWRNNLPAIRDAACRVKPYISAKRVGALNQLMHEYHTATKQKGSGFMPANLAGLYADKPGDAFADPVAARSFLIEVLNKMTSL